MMTYETEIGICVASAGWDTETPDKIRWEVVNDIVVTPTHWMYIPNNTVYTQWQEKIIGMSVSMDVSTGVAFK